MTLNIKFSPEIEAKLKQRSEAAGKPVEEVIAQAVERYLADSQHAPELSKEEKLREFREWVASHPRRPGVHLDDSRESIYEGRGE